MDAMEKDEFGMSDAEKDKLEVLSEYKDEFEIHEVSREEFEIHAAVHTLIDAERVRSDTLLMKKVMPALVKQLRATKTAALEAKVVTQQSQMMGAV